MMIAGREIAGRLLATIAGGVLLVVLFFIVLAQCDKRRDQAAQSRVDSAQKGAAAESGADAVNTVARSGEAAAASEELSRQNERDIRAAEGAGERVGAGVNAAGLQALCRREAYKNSERCKTFRRDR